MGTPEQSHCDAVTERYARTRREFPRSTQQYLPPPDRYPRGCAHSILGPAHRKEDPMRTISHFINGQSVTRAGAVTSPV